MKKAKEGFILYKSFYPPIKNLTNEELGRLFKAIFEYQLKKELPDNSIGLNVKMAFDFFQNQFRLDDAKYERFIEGQRVKGLLSAKKRSAKNHHLGLKKSTVVDRSQPMSTYKAKAKDKDKELAKPLAKKSEHEEQTPILQYVYEKVLPFRKNIRDKKSYAKMVASDIAKKILAHKQEILYPEEDKWKGAAFKSRAELGIEKTNLRSRLKPEWSLADRLWFAVDHGLGWEYLKEKGFI